MTSSRQRNDEGRRGRRGFSGPPKAARARVSDAAGEWLWGWHAVAAALANERREPPKRLLATRERAAELQKRFGKLPSPEILESAEIGRALPAGVVHQGIALRTEPLESLSLEEMASPAGGVILMLDQVTDPQNVGAVFRSAAAFGARGIVLQDRHAPPLAGALAKAAAGAVDIVPHARVVNLSRALETLAELGWRAVGLDGAAKVSLAEAMDAQPTVLVLGSEGEGIRRLVAEHCDALAAIPMPGGFESLNVSAAAAIALYEAVRTTR